MSRQPVETYLRRHSDVSNTALGLWVRADYPMAGYGILVGKVTPLDASVVAHLKHADFEPTELKVCINNGPARLDSRIGDWVNYNLGYALAENYELVEVEITEGSQSFVSTVLTKKDVDGLIAAVREYDRLSGSREAQELREGLRNIVGEGIDKLLVDEE